MARVIKQKREVLGEPATIRGFYLPHRVHRLIRKHAKRRGYGMSQLVREMLEREIGRIERRAAR